MLIYPADLLALPDLSPRPCQRPQLDCLQDVPPNLQQSPAHRLWYCGAPAEREDQGEHTARHRPLESGASEYRSTLSPRPCWAIGNCAGAKAPANRGHHLRQCADGKGGEEQDSHGRLSTG